MTINKLTMVKFKTENGITYKTCNGNKKLNITCGWKPLDQFSPNGTDSDGNVKYRGQCKTCRNPPKIKEVETERKCVGMGDIKGCDKTKSLNEFPETGRANKEGVRNRRYICNDCYNKSRRVKKRPILKPKQIKHQEKFSKTVSELIELKLESIDGVFQQCKGEFCDNSVKPLVEFAKSGKNSYRKTCKPCHNKTKIKSNEGVVLKICETCENICRPELLNDDLLPEILCLICKPRPVIKVTDSDKKQCLGICGKVLSKEMMLKHSTGANFNTIYRALCKDCDKYNRRHDKYLIRNSDRLEKDELFYKHCNDCDKWLEENDFYKAVKNSDGLNDLCVSCYKIKQENHRKDNEAYRLQTNKRIRERLKTDPAFKLKHNNRKRVHDLVTGKRLNTDEYIGCNSKEFVKHIENQFREGMTWDNYGGKRTDWVIDHIVPLASFDMSNEEEAKRGFHYTNCQPLWFVENAFKSDRTNLKPEDYKLGRDYDFSMEV